MEQRELNDTDGLRVLPGAKELLAALPPDRYTIVTSGTRQLATKRLQVAGLPVPAKMITADDVTRGKPDPEPYLAGAAALGFEPQECLVFEDAPSGIRSAKAGGMMAIAVTTTYRAEELSQADLIVPSLKAVRVAIAESGELEVMAGTTVERLTSRWAILCNPDTQGTASTYAIPIVKNCHDERSEASASLHLTQTAGPSAS